MRALPERTSAARAGSNDVLAFRGEPKDAELLVEFAGRACYRSWEPGLNANVTRVRTDRREYHENILRSAHGSVLEHASSSVLLCATSPALHARARAPPRRLGVQPGEPALRAADGHRLPRAAHTRAAARESARDRRAARGVPAGGGRTATPRRGWSSLSREEGSHLGNAPPGADRAVDGHHLDRERAHPAPRDRDADRSGRRGGTAARVRRDRADHAARGAAALPGVTSAARTAAGCRPTARC